VGKNEEHVSETINRTAGLIIEAIESGAANPRDWSAPWHNLKTTGLPVRVSDGQPYTGGNLFLVMMLEQLGAGHTWGTFEQWKAAGGQVRKGETATWLLRPLTIRVEDAETGEKRERSIGRFRGFATFHSGQVDGWSEPVAEPGEPVADDVHQAFRWGALTGAQIVESATAGASYSPTFDRVTMPDRDRFADAHGCWSTLAHELVHWTGHEGRLARTFGKRFGDDAYAAEELCAELGAAFTLATIGRSTEPRPDHAQYLAHWLRVLKADPGALWAVAGKASKAAEFLTGRAGDVARVAA
jgi:antirestriction protein ArdC